MREFKLKELCQCISPLPLAVQISNHPHYQEIHLHDCIEIVYIRQGAGWCAVDGVIHPMATGDLYVIPQGATHEYYNDVGFNYVNCLFNEEIFREDEQELYRYFLPCTPDHLAVKYTFGFDLQNEIVSRFEKLNAELRGDAPHHLALARALFVQIIVFIIRNAMQAPCIQAAVSQKQLGRALGYIAGHLSEKITIEKLAEISGYRASYLPKLFQDQIGCSIAKYIESRRLERAALTLGNARDSVESIAIANGFFDASYFIKVFRKRFGMTPLKFRAKAVSPGSRPETDAAAAHR